MYRRKVKNSCIPSNHIPSFLKLPKRNGTNHLVFQPEFPDFPRKDCKGRTIRKLIGGGGAGEVQKNNSRKGKLNEKNSCTPINPKKYSCYGLKNIHTRNLIAKKIPSARKFPSPSPTHNFSNGPSLNGKCPKYPTLARPSAFTNRL